MDVQSDRASALERLRTDHQEVLARLSNLLVALDGVTDVAHRDVEVEMRGLLDFVRQEVWYHFKREEEALFPAIARVFPSENAPVAGGPVHVLTEEHGVLRKLVARFAEEVDRWAAGIGSSAGAVRLTGTQMIRAFQKHIYKEDNIVFRLTEQMLTPDELAAINSAFAVVTMP